VERLSGTTEEGMDLELGCPVIMVRMNFYAVIETRKEALLSDIQKFLKEHSADFGLCTFQAQPGDAYLPRLRNRDPTSSV
jgi:hypothetical protein